MMPIGRRVTAWLAGTMAALLVAVAPALGADPAIIISLKSYKELASDAQYLGATIGQPQLGIMLPALVAQAGGGQLPKGFDTTKPIVGYVVLSAEGQPTGGAVCIPVTNAKDFAGALAAVLPDATTEGEITTYQVPNAPFPVVGKAGAKHYFLSIMPDALKELPDPGKLTKSTADISVEIDLSKIPDNLKEAFLAQVEASAAAGTPPAADEITRMGQEAGQKVTLAGMRRLVLDGERLGIGLNIDPTAKNVSLDVNIASKSGTTLASACTNLSKTFSPFSGLISSQAIGSLLISAPLNQDMQELYGVLFDGALAGAKKASEEDPNSPEAAKKEMVAFFTRLLGDMKQTVALARVDQAVVVNPVGGGKIQIVAAQKVAKGKELAAQIEELLVKLKKEGKVPGEIKVGVATIAGARVHFVKPKSADDSPFGDGPAHFAITNDMAVGAIGGDSLAAVRKVLESKPATTGGPIALRVKLSNLLPILPAESRVPDEISQAAFAEGRDEISLQIGGQTTGAKIRLEIQEGVLKLIGLAANRGNQ